MKNNQTQLQILFNQRRNQKKSQQNKSRVTLKDKSLINEEGDVIQKRSNYHREYYKRNREKILKKREKYWKEYMRVYRQRPEVKKRRNIRKNQRRKIDSEYRIRRLLRGRLFFAIKKYSQTGKIMSSKKYGIDYESIIEHLKPFPKDTSLYHIDHIRPLCSFDLTDLKQVKQAFAPENHQWLTIKENLIKGGKYNDVATKL